jgi:hypothetical protein
VPPRLPRFDRSKHELADAASSTRSSTTLATTDPDGIAREADGHGWARRRGLPVIGIGVRGVMPHTDPVAELLAKERGGRAAS